MITVRSRAEAVAWLGEAAVTVIEHYGPSLWIDTPGNTATIYRNGTFRTVKKP